MFRVATHATYLGFEVGPEAQANQWMTVIAKISKRAEDIQQLLLCNAHIASLTMYKAQLAPLSGAALHATIKALRQGGGKLPQGISCVVRQSLGSPQKRTPCRSGPRRRP